MCEPTTIIMGISLAVSAVSAYGQIQTGKAQAKAIGAQNQVQEDEIAKAAGQELTERARSARRERGSMRASASEAGVNLNSGSFVSALQTSVQNQYNDMGLIVQNEKGQQAARKANANSAMSRVQIPSYLGAALQVGADGYTGYQSGKAIEDAAIKKANK